MYLENTLTPESITLSRISFEFTAFSNALNPLLLKAKLIDLPP